MYTPELSLLSRILYTTRMRQLLTFPPAQYNRPIPPYVLIRPSSTLSPPGPTCFQPVRSLPLNSCFHAFSFACGTATSAGPMAVKTKAAQLKPTDHLPVMPPPSRIAAAQACRAGQSPD